MPWVQQTSRRGHEAVMPPELAALGRSRRAKTDVERWKGAAHLGFAVEEQVAIHQ